MAVKQTAVKDALGEFAPKFAELNDEVLFGQVWSREDKLSLRDRSLVTVVALMAQGLTDSSFRYHLTAAKNNGITRCEIAEILTHGAFYAGWPKAWAAFRMAKKAAEEAAASGTEQPKENKVTKIASGFLGVVVLIALAAGGGFYFYRQQMQKKKAEKEALDPDANYTEDKGGFEIPTDVPDEDETPDEQDTELI